MKYKYLCSKLLARIFAGCMFLVSSANGIIIYEPNITPFRDPPPEELDVFAAVARVCDENGGNTSGSATYIRDKYLLTAHQVADRSHVTFDGVTFYERDTNFEPKQIIADGLNVDLKVIKLLEVPDFSGTEIVIPLATNDGSDSNTFTSIDNFLLVGWGVGNGIRVEDMFSSKVSWSWGDDTTIAKRWGVNEVERSDELFEGAYQYESLVTSLDVFYANESGIARFDEGGGFFKKIDNTWQLIGIATHATENSEVDTSTFDFFSAPDLNYFVRISSYIDEIAAAMVDTPPDPMTYAGWILEQGLANDDAEVDADTDGDGMVQLLEFALGGNPYLSDNEIYPASQLITVDNSTFFEMTLTRPQGLQSITYSPELSLDLSNWAAPGAFDPPIAFETDVPVAIGNGTEQVKYRIALDQDQKLFLRLRVTEGG